MANFKIPNSNKLDTEQSTYKQYISNMVQSDSLGPGTAQLMSNLKESSITIGGKNMNKLACITEASQ